MRCMLGVQPLLDDTIVTFLQKLGAPTEDAETTAATLEAMHGIKSARDLRAIAPSGCEDNCHVGLEELGVPGSGSRIVAVRCDALLLSLSNSPSLRHEYRSAEWAKFP